MPKTYPPIHPGEILNEEFLKALNLSQYRLAVSIKVPPRRINEIVKGQRSITTDTAVRLGLFFGVSTEFWLNLQQHYEIEVAKATFTRKIEREVTTHAQLLAAAT